MKKMFLIKSRHLLLALGFLLSLYTSAQVTVGGDSAPNAFSILEISTANVKGGLRLPHLSNGERDDLSATSAFVTAKNRPGGAALGLTIYNTDTNCIEYWDGNKWVSLCLGTAEITFNDEAGDPTPSDLHFPAEGGDQGPFVPVDVPNCTTENPPYAFALMTGTEYTFIDIIDASTGKFIVHMEPNPMARERSAILRITNNCSGEYKEFIFSQDGDASDCGTTASVPDIKSNSGNEICRDGSILLYLDGYPAGTFIWALAGKEVGRGNFLSVTEPGKYTVYGDKIGCANSKEITLTKGSTSAPAPVDFIVIGNNGVACGTGGKVELIVTNVSSGNIVWYKDGVKTAESGRKINADKGRWFVIVEDGTCNSLPSKAVDVIENGDQASLAEPAIKVNDVVVGESLNLCRGGSMYLQVNNIDANARYTWYINNDEVATGVSAYVPVPALNQFILRVRATGTGCAIEALVEANISAGQAPSVPNISVNTSNALCGGEATLTASSPGATSYRWFKDGVEINGETTETITINEVGAYTASALKDACASIQSAPRSIIASDFATISWVSNPATANVGDTKTYSVNLNFTQSASYTWSVYPTSVGAITNGQGTPSVTVRFNEVNTLDAKIICTATNACGTADGSPLEQTVSVDNACTEARILGVGKLSHIAKVNQTVALSVTANGTGPITYKWYKNMNIGGAFTLISGAESATYNYNTGSDLGSFEFYCEATAASPCNTTIATSPTFTVAVASNPETIPVGTGSFSGKTCFDIAESNGNTNSCGTVISREGQKTNFENRTPQNSATSTAPYSGVQIYTFKPTGTVSNLYFDYVDPSGKVIEDIREGADYLSMSSISSECTVTVEFNPLLNDLLLGTTRETGYKAELYVVYNDKPAGAGNERRLKLTLNLQDCACCGAKTTTGGWLTFMCHNLGADESLNPFTTVGVNGTGGGGTVGWLYQWGRQSDGHQSRYSTPSKSQSTTSTPNNAYFYYGSGNWLIPRLDALWGDGTQDENVPKGVNDPCPTGWKVPSQKQWLSILGDQNTWTWSYGYKVGEALFLPVTGSRGGLYYGDIKQANSLGVYWSSTVSNYAEAYVLIIQYPYPAVLESTYRGLGEAVRCVAE